MKKIIILILAVVALHFVPACQTSISGGVRIPSVSGQSGKYLSNNGTTYNWSTVATSPSLTVNQVGFGSAVNTLTSTSNVVIRDAANCLVIGGGGGVSSANEPAGQPPAVFELVSNNENTQAFNMKTYGATPGTQNDMHFYRYDGTPSAPTNTKLNMYLMSTGYRGFGTTPSQSSVAFQVKASENWSETAQGANVIFQTTPNGQAVTGGRRSAFVINNDQRIFLTKAETTYSPYRSTGILNIDMTNASSPGSPLNIGAIFTHSTSQSTSIVMGSSTTDEGYIYHYGSAVAGNFDGTTLPIAGGLDFRAGGFSDKTMRLSGSAIALCSGTLSTSNAVRIDNVGLRIGNNGNVQSANTSAFVCGGSVAITNNTKTAAYTLVNGDYMINCTSGTFTLTLPTAVGISGRIYVLKNSGAGVITIATTSAQTIDGAATQSLATQYAKTTVMSDGANWIVIQ